MAVLSGILNSTEWGIKYPTSANKGVTGKVDATLDYGRVRYVSATHTVGVGDTLASGAVIKFFKMPKGAKLVQMWVTSDDLGTTGTGTLGWSASFEKDEFGAVLEAASANGFYSALDFNTAALSRSLISTAAAGCKKRFKAEVDVQLTMTAATTTNGSIQVEAFIVVD